MKAQEHGVPGAQVRVQTLWGSELGVVDRLLATKSTVMAQLQMESGDTIVIDVARLAPRIRSAVDE